eukprot:9476276-Pyramimonas_sp.AAC.2
MASGVEHGPFGQRGEQRRGEARQRREVRQRREERREARRGGEGAGHEEGERGAGYHGVEGREGSGKRGSAEGFFVEEGSRAPKAPSRDLLYRLPRQGRVPTAPLLHYQSRLHVRRRVSIIGVALCRRPIVRLGRGRCFNPGQFPSGKIRNERLVLIGRVGGRK